MKLFSFSTDPIVQAFGWMLLHAVWQGFVITFLAAGILFLLRRRASYGRYWTGISALFLQIVVSAGTFALYYQPRALQVAIPKVTHFAQPFVAKSTQVMVSMPWYKQTLWFLQSNLDTIVLFWIIGASVLLLRLIGSWVYVQQLKAEGIRLTESRIQEMFRRIAVKLNIRSTVHLFESVRVSTPVVIGFMKPVVLLPVGLATGLTTKQIEAILAHELAHVKRFDYLVNLIQSLVEVVYFFHPALWWLSSRVRAEREHCCDDVAVQVCGDKLAFARALAEVEAFRQSPALAMAFASKKGMMLQRVKRVLGVTEKPQRRMSPNVLVLFVLLVFGVSVYAFQQHGKPKQPKAKNISHTSDGTKIVLDEKGKLSKVVWKKRQLPLREVAELQRLKEKIEEGELSLQNVKDGEQKAILTRVTEVENGLHEGLLGLSGGLAKMNAGLSELRSINVDASLFSDAQLEAISNEALLEAQPVVDAITATFPDSIDEAKMAFHQRKMDSLSRMMEPQHQKMEALRLEMEQYEFKTSELERKMEVLEWKRSKFYDERSQLLEKRGQIMHQEGQKVKKAEAEIEKDLSQFEEKIKQQETQIQQLNQQVAEVRQQVKTARQPVEELENQMRKLEEINEKYSREMEFHSVEMTHAFPPPPPPVERVKARAPRAVVKPAPFPDAIKTPTPKAPRARALVAPAAPKKK
uniref:Regulatory sensor-transducer, BlaR1/MecR1 family / TonB family protein n=1 Tax=uncultured bacterium A1Q1_fos_1093 TaxID=1256542 RepID=L7VXF1_9BACT|nr:regulatory sensor-transducer, BlaR1/MecR1 family / TonB family protein [uncultured bacterium A1Q1_fos_1093]